MERGTRSVDRKCAGRAGNGAKGWRLDQTSRASLSQALSGSILYSQPGQGHTMVLCIKLFALIGWTRAVYRLAMRHFYSQPSCLAKGSLDCTGPQALIAATFRHKSSHTPAGCDLWCTGHSSTPGHARCKSLTEQLLTVHCIVSVSAYRGVKWQTSRWKLDS